MKQHEPKSRASHIDCSVAKQLRKHRILAGVSQEEMGKAANVSLQQIQKYENASNRISSGRLYNFAKFLNVPINYFFEFQDDGVNTEKPVISDDSEITAEGISDINFVNEKDVLSLVKSFIGIKNLQTRKKILELIKIIS